LNKGEEHVGFLNEEESRILDQLGLLSIKPKIIVCNVDEESLSTGNKYTEMVNNKFPSEKVVIICADIEDQIMGLDPDERHWFE
jgi:ribosome-binding ATPase YchF (GTP1/OBG family)